NIQQQLSSKTVLQVGYVGSQGHRLWRFFDISQPNQATITAADCNPDCATGTIQDFSVPRNYGANPYGAFYILQQNSTGKSNYNALQTSFRVNGWHGVTSTVNFVWSRSMDNSSDGEDFEPNAAQPNDSTRPNLEYGPSNFNIPSRFTWIFGYDIPKMDESGQPFQFNYNFESDFSGSGEGFDRPDSIGPTVYHPNDPLHYVDLSTFAIP